MIDIFSKLLGKYNKLSSTKIIPNDLSVGDEVITPTDRSILTNHPTRHDYKIEASVKPTIQPSSFRVDSILNEFHRKVSKIQRIHRINWKIGVFKHSNDELSYCIVTDNTGVFYGHSEDEVIKQLMKVINQ